MSHALIPSLGPIPRRTPEASHLRTAEQAVAYLVAGVLRGGGVLSPATLELLRARCAELDALAGGVL